MGKMDKKEVMDKIRERYKKMRTLAVKDYGDDNTIEIVGMEYKGKQENYPTESQIYFLLSLGNTFGYKDNLLRGNRWFISACIDIAKDYPYQEFRINVS